MSQVIDQKKKVWTPEFNLKDGVQLFLVFIVGSLVELKLSHLAFSGLLPLGLFCLAAFLMSAFSGHFRKIFWSLAVLLGFVTLVL